MKRNYSFSLIEMMVVLAIVALLATIGLPSYKHYLISSRINSVLPFLSELQKQVSDYYLEHGVFPASNSINSVINTEYIISIANARGNGVDAEWDAKTAKLTLILDPIGLGLSSDATYMHLNLYFIVKPGTTMIQSKCLNDTDDPYVVATGDVYINNCLGPNDLTGALADFIDQVGC